MVCIEKNDLTDIIISFARHGFRAEAVCEKKLPSEHLFVIMAKRM